MLAVGNFANIRLNKAYPNLSNEIVPQPIDIKKYKICNTGKYYLSLARYSKNVDKIILAFQKMPDKELRVYGSGTEAEKEYIGSLAKGYPNIHIMGFAEEKDLPEIYGNCIAAIAINIEEDVTMNLREALASGKPGICINPDKNSEEKMIVGKTGIKIKDSSVENICAAVNTLNPNMAYAMRFDCKEKAKQYSSDNFVDTILKRLQ